jgi:hypothetical protein
MSITPTGDLGGALAAFRVQTGPQTGEDVPVRLPVVTIGSAGQNDIVVADDSVSSTHARLEFANGNWRITDLESRNGTFAEGERLAALIPTPLSYGSTVRLGGARLLFRAVEDADPDAARSSYTPPEARPTIRGRRSGFRLPVWLLILLLVLVVAALVLFGWLASEPTTVPAPGTTPAAVLVAFPTSGPVAVGW